MAELIVGPYFNQDSPPEPDPIPDDPEEINLKQGIGPDPNAPPPWVAAEDDVPVLAPTEPDEDPQEEAKEEEKVGEAIGSLPQPLEETKEIINTHGAPILSARISKEISAMVGDGTRGDKVVGFGGPGWEGVIITTDPSFPPTLMEVHFKGGGWGHYYIEIPDAIYKNLYYGEKVFFETASGGYSGSVVDVKEGKLFIGKAPGISVFDITSAIRTEDKPAMTEVKIPTGMEKLEAKKPKEEPPAKPKKKTPAKGKRSTSKGAKKDG